MTIFCTNQKSDPGLYQIRKTDKIIIKVMTNIAKNGHPFWIYSYTYSMDCDSRFSQDKRTKVRSNLKLNVYFNASCDTKLIFYQLSLFYHYVFYVAMNSPPWPPPPITVYRAGRAWKRSFLGKDDICESPLAIYVNYWSMPTSVTVKKI